jgi:hypothetical protein
VRRAVWLAGAALAFTSSLALAAPESLLPPIFADPSPTPAPRPAPAPAPTPAPGASPPSGSSPVIQPVPSSPTPPPAAPPRVTLPADFPSLQQLEAMDQDEFDELFGLRPRFDMPAAARRAVREVGVLSAEEGGFAAGSLDNQPAELVRAALAANQGQVVSRWGHILLRRTLASRLDAPSDMDPVAFAALRASLLNRMGEPHVARALVQDVDSANYNTALATAALDAYLATGDVLGICPVAQLRSTLRDDPEWTMSRSICAAYSGQGRDAERELDRALYYGLAPRVDVLLAQRYAGAAGDRRREVNVEWDRVEELTPWRYALARALGLELPDTLRRDAGERFDIQDVLVPATPLSQRVTRASTAGARGVISSSAMVDLYSQLWADGTLDGDGRLLREAYVAQALEDRMAALRELWGDGGDYGRQVLTAYAAARLPVDPALLDDAPRIIASMLAAGLDRNAMRWGATVREGSEGWALLALAQPTRQAPVRAGAVESFMSNDGSAARRKSRFLVAGLAGLGRLDSGAANSLAGQLGVDLGRESAWSRKIDLAGELGNPALVALLAGLGMQGASWEGMTARHLFHIVRALDRVGLSAEARMIAAEAVARG